MQQKTTINIQNVLSGEISIRRLFEHDPKSLDWLAGNAANFLRENKINEAFFLIEGVLKVCPDHGNSLFHQGEYYLENRDVPKAKEAFSKLLNLVRSGKETNLVAREGTVSNLSTAICLYMYVAKESLCHDEVHELFQEIYTEHTKDRGKLSADERDIKNIAHCLSRIDKILSEPQGSPEWTHPLMVDLRKLLWDDKASDRKALLARCGINILLPSIVGHKSPQGLPPGMTLQVSIPMGSQPLTARPDILYDINDWIKQPIIYLERSYSFQEIIKFLANTDGAHANSQAEIEKKHSSSKSGKITLVKNDQVTYDLVYKICAFLMTWLAEYSELLGHFPILKEYRGKYKFNFLVAGFIPDWCNETGPVSVRL